MLNSYLLSAAENWFLKSNFYCSIYVRTSNTFLLRLFWFCCFFLLFCIRLTSDITEYSTKVKYRLMFLFTIFWYKPIRLWYFFKFSSCVFIISMLSWKTFSFRNTELLIFWIKQLILSLIPDSLHTYCVTGIAKQRESIGGLISLILSLLYFWYHPFLVL